MPRDKPGWDEIGPIGRIGPIGKTPTLRAPLSSRPANHIQVMIEPDGDSDHADEHDQEKE